MKSLYNLMFHPEKKLHNLMFQLLKSLHNLISHHGSKLPVPLNRGRLLVVANFVRDHLKITDVTGVTCVTGVTGVTVSQPVPHVSQVSQPVSHV